MERRRHHTSKRGAASACASCDKPAMSGARAKSAKKNHVRGDRKASHSSQALERNDATNALQEPVLLADATNGEPPAEKTAAEHKPTPLALAPQHMPMPYVVPQAARSARADDTVVASKPRKMHRFLIGGGAAAMLAVALFGMWRSPVSGSAAVASIANASERIEAPAMPLADSGKPITAPPSGRTTPSSQKVTAAKPVTNAKKPASSTSVAAKKSATHATTEHAADGTRKKPAEKLASISKKAPAQALPAASREQDNIVVASNSPVVNRYAQCQQLSLLRREQCKWQVCSGKWGQDGCPSYENESKTF